VATTIDQITKTPGVCGGFACIRGTRIPVWLLLQWHRLGKSDAWILDGYSGLTSAELEAAWEYAAGHPAEMDEAIRLNAEA